MITVTDLKYKHLLISGNENLIILLGYKLNLTKTEYLILKALIKNPSTPLSAEDISEEICFILSKENLCYHISNINHKAKTISNRLLVKNIAKIGYFLNEEM